MPFWEVLKSTKSPSTTVRSMTKVIQSSSNTPITSPHIPLQYDSIVINYFRATTKSTLSSNKVVPMSLVEESSSIYDHD